MIFINVHSQNRWEVYLGHPYRTDYTNYLIETYDRGYILAGGCKGVDGMIMKTDINGSLLYEKDFQYNNEMVVIAAIQDSSGNTYQCGLLVVYGTISWPYLAKFDSCGNKVWCNVYNGSPEYMDGWAKDIVFGNNNEIIVLTRLNNLEQNKQIFLFAYDTYGNNLWIKAYATKDDHPLIANAGAYHVIKNKMEFFISGFCYWPFPGDTNHVYLRPFYIGIDSNYNEKWILPFAVEDSVFGHAFSLASLNDSVIVGVGDRWIDGNSKNSLLMFFNDEGETLGYYQVSNSDIGNDVLYNGTLDVAKINDSVFICPAIWEHSNGERIQGELVLGCNGNIIRLAERESVYGNPIILKTSNNNFLISNEVTINSNNIDILLYKINDSLQSVPFDTNQYTYDSLCPYPITSETIDLSDCIIWTDTEEIPNPEEYYSKQKTIPIKTFPNPARDRITFAFENTDNHKNIKLECYDIFGRQLHEQMIYTGQQEAEADVSKWGKGIYVVVVKSNGKVVGKTKFVVE